MRFRTFAFCISAFDFLRVDRRGIEPRFSACKADVVPLDQQPIINHALQRRSVRDSNSIYLLTEQECRLKHLRTEKENKTRN